MRLILALASVFGDNPEFVSIFLRELANPKGKALDKIAEVIKKSGGPKAVRTVFSDAIERNEFRPLDPDQAMVAFVTVSIGYFLLAPMIDRILNMPDKQKFIEERQAQIIDIFLNGVRNK